MEIISEEIDRYSLQLSEDEYSEAKEELTIPSVDVPLEKLKSSGDKQWAKVVRYMNTYRLESKRPFNVEHVTALLKEVLTRDLATAHYEPNNMTKMCVNLAGEIRNKVKQLNYDRYKLVCLVQIVEKHRQSVLSTARFLWDTDRDSYAVFSMNNAHIAAMGCVFGIYYE
ncbi:dynein light chain Tctex-type protein 2B [Macrosteles quadrilineatus]|uniref:dynein light chain Tctex-type protein 2B n=1 Tax=Macrosteles quadrilineatus TaxID=74068 RepID=UPI0023E2605D|nr:dynein light chain Tctex-type protein 2B [Macrosteles quadrilineatus]